MILVSRSIWGETLLDQLVLFVCDMFFDVFLCFGWLQGLVVGNDSKQFSVRFWPQPKEVEGPYSECPTPGHGSVVVDWDMTNPATAENVFKLWNQRWKMGYCILFFLDVQYHPVRYCIMIFSALEFWNWNLARKKPHNDVQWVNWTGQCAISMTLPGALYSDSGHCSLDKTKLYHTKRTSLNSNFISIIGLSSRMPWKESRKAV